MTDVMEERTLETPHLVGARVPRVEDRRLITGKGRYIDDLEMAGAMHIRLVRSPHAHARIVSIDDTALKEAYPEAIVFTGKDCPHVGIKADIAKPGYQPSFQPSLAVDTVRFVGDPVAAVLTGDPYRSEDAADLLEIEYEPLEPITEIEQAMSPETPGMHPEWKDNVYIRRIRGDGDIEEARRQADHVITRTFRTRRHTGVPMECRGCLAYLDPTGTQLTLYSSTQVPHMVRTYVANQLGWPENKIRVVAPDVGGGFGIKGSLSAEEPLIAWIATQVDRPVKWIEDRIEHMMASFHARDHLHELEAYVRDDGRVLGIKARIIVDAGAYSVFPWTAGSDSGMAANVLIGPYDIPNYRAEDIAVATNKCPLNTYRGVGRPSAVFSMERLMDEIAHELKMDPIEFRLKNVVRSFPHRSPTGLIYDSGSYAESLEKMKDLLDYDRLREEQKEAKARGEYLGIGVIIFCEQTAHGTKELAGRGMPILAGYESATVEMDTQGRVIVYTGLQSHGQGMETSFAQVAADQLGVPLDHVKVIHGDTANSPYAMGTWGSRGAVLGGGSTMLAAQDIREKLLEIAAHNLEIGVEDLEFRDFAVQVKGAPGRSIPIATLARWALIEPQHLPEAMSPGLTSTRYVNGIETGVFSNACHGCVVRVDPELGKVDILRYISVEDCGVMLNPLIVDGQVQGGVAQGIGSGLLEELVYGPDGQFLSSTFADYLMPSMTTTPNIEVYHIETPSPLTPLGNKGMGEAGAIGPMGAIGTAVSDALDLSVTEVPLNLVRTWKLATTGKEE